VLDAGRTLVGVVPRQRLVGFLGDEQGEPAACGGHGKDGKKVTTRA